MIRRRPLTLFWITSGVLDIQVSSPRRLRNRDDGSCSAGFIIRISYYQIALTPLQLLVLGEYLEAEAGENERGCVASLKLGGNMVGKRMERVLRKQVPSGTKARGFLHRANQSPTSSGGNYD
jgi:hypothetical protein